MSAKQTMEGVNTTATTSLVDENASAEKAFSWMAINARVLVRR